MRAVALLALLALVAAAQAGPTFLGVLDHPQCKEGDAVSGRILFTKTASEWEGVDAATKSPTQEWTVALRGRRLGRLTLLDTLPDEPPADAWYYGRDKAFTPHWLEPLRHVPNDAKRFGGWCSTPSARPLVLVTGPHVTDPDQWKRFRPPPSYRRKLHGALLEVIGAANSYRCAAGGDTTKPHTFRSDETVLYAGYRSSTGLELVAIGVNFKKAQRDCDGPSPREWGSQWFVLGSGSVKYVGGNLDLIDVGDYDGDGHSEALFWSSEYNRDGYVLLWDGFQKRAEFLWRYH